MKRQNPDQQHRIYLGSSECSFCRTPIRLPSELEELVKIIEESRRQRPLHHKSQRFYVSRTGSIYCDRMCHCMFTED
jgi:hypothetical protein